MLISATYICPVRGLTSLEPPDPATLGKAAKTAKALNIERLWLPVLEEALMRPGRARVSFLDGLIRALDRMEDAGLSAGLVAPATKVLGLYWAFSQLVKPGEDPRAEPVFLEGRIRHLWPFDWWEDIGIVQKRIRTFRELASAVSGHPALQAWLILDRAMEWVRPPLSAAGLVLQSFLAEIRERHEEAQVLLGLGWKDLLNPDRVKSISRYVDGIRLAGLEDPIARLEGPRGASKDLLASAYVGTMSQWLFSKPIEVETGWTPVADEKDTEGLLEAGGRLALQGLNGIVWVTLMDPEPLLSLTPPWNCRPEAKGLGILNSGGDPKERLEELLEEIGRGKPRDDRFDFIDIGIDEYREEPEFHFGRLWRRFCE